MPSTCEVSPVSSPGAKIVNNSTFSMWILVLLLAMTISFFAGQLGLSPAKNLIPSTTPPTHLYRTNPGLASSLGLLSPMPIGIHHDLGVVVLNVNSGMYLSKTKQTQSFTNATIFQLIQVPNQPHTYIFRISGSHPTQVLTATRKGLEISPLDGYNGSNFQHWKVETHSTPSNSQFEGLSYLRISSAANGKVLDVSGNSKQENANVIIYPLNKPPSDNQHWVIVPIDIELAIKSGIEHQRRQEQQMQQQNQSQTGALAELLVLRDENKKLMVENTNLKQINSSQIEKADKERKFVEGIVSLCKANAQFYQDDISWSNAELRVEIRSPQLGRQIHTSGWVVDGNTNGPRPYVKLLDLLFSKPTNTKNNINTHINPKNSDQSTTYGSILNHYWKPEDLAGRIPKLTPGLKLFFATPNIANGQWVQFHGPGAKLFDVDPTFELTLGSLLDFNKRDHFKSFNSWTHQDTEWIEDGFKEGSSPYTISIKWE